MGQYWLEKKLGVKNEHDKKFEKWYNENKDSDLLLGDYDDFVTESKQAGLEIDSFEEWAKKLFDSIS